MKNVTDSTGSARAYFSDLGRLRMLGGDAALDFANTQHWRGERQMDFLPDYVALAGWAVPAGLLAEAELEPLLTLDRSEPEAARNIHIRTIALRTTWRDFLAGVIERRSEAQSADPLRVRLDRLVVEAFGDPCLAIVGLPVGIELQSASLALPLARIGLSIASFINLPIRGIARMCEGDPCGGFFLDASRSKPRRWCTMDGCGNRNKVRRHRSRMVAEAVEIK